MLVNNIISKAKYQNEKAERLIVKMQKYRKFFFNEYVYYIKYQQDITTINKKNTTNWHFYSTAKTFFKLQTELEDTILCVYIYINIKKPNIHFNLQHDISDPTFCASDPKPKIKKPFNVFNFQNYYLAH